MATDVVMPQMGESIAEGTVVRWMKKPGEKVERDEPLLEISTDKVDAEIPSPAAGTLSEILVKEGQTVAVNSVVARIAGSGEAAAQPGEQRAASSERAVTPPPAPKPAAPAQPGEQRAASSERPATPPPAPEQKATPVAPAQPREQRAVSS